jgi:hypothetical protein
MAKITIEEEVGKLNISIEGLTELSDSLVRVIRAVNEARVFRRLKRIEVDV